MHRRSQLNQHVLSDEESSASTDLPEIYLKKLSNNFDNEL